MLFFFNWLCPRQRTGSGTMTSSQGWVSGRWSRRQERSWSPCMALGTRVSRTWATAATSVLSCRPSSASQNSRERKSPCRPGHTALSSVPSVSTPVTMCWVIHPHQPQGISPHHRGVTSCTEAGWERLSNVTGIRWGAESLVTEKTPTGLVILIMASIFRPSITLCAKEILIINLHSKAFLPMEVLEGIQWSMSPSWWVEFQRGFRHFTFCYSKWFTVELLLWKLRVSSGKFLYQFDIAMFYK